MAPPISRKSHRKEAAQRRQEARRGRDRCATSSPTASISATGPIGPRSPSRRGRACPLPPATHRPRLNQRDTSACTGFALATVVHVLTSRRDSEPADPVSPFMLYGMARRYDELRGEAPDGGSSLRGALKGWFKHGVCEQAALAEARRAAARRRARDWWDDGVRRPLGAYYRVDSRSVVDMQVALNETGVLLASALAHAGWDDGYTRKGGRKAAPNGIWTIPYPWKANPDDGHAFAIVGYDEDGFIVQNSWGDGWGTHGLAILTYEDWIKHGYDCWVAQLGVVTRRHEAQATGTRPRYPARGSARRAARSSTCTRCRRTSSTPATTASCRPPASFTRRIRTSRNWPTTCCRPSAPNGTFRQVHPSTWRSTRTAGSSTNRVPANPRRNG